MIDDPAAVCSGPALRSLVSELQEHFVGASALTEVAREELESYLARVADGVRIGGPRYTTDVLVTTEAGDQKARDTVSRAFDAMAELDGHINGTRRLPEAEVERLRGVLAGARTPGWFTPVSVKSQEDVLDSTASTATIKFCSIARFTRGEHTPAKRNPASARAVAERVFTGLNHSWRLERSVLEQSHRENERARVAGELRVVFFRLLNERRQWRFDIYEWDLGSEVDVRAYDWSWSKTEGAARVIGSQEGQPVWIIDLKSARLLLRISLADPHISTGTVFEPHGFLARIANAQASLDSAQYDKRLTDVANLIFRAREASSECEGAINMALEECPQEAMREIDEIQRERVHWLVSHHEWSKEVFQAVHQDFLSERYDAYRMSTSEADEADSRAVESPLWLSLRDEIDEVFEYSILEIQEMCEEARRGLSGVEARHQPWQQ